MKKKNLAAILALILALTLVATGCGNGTSDEEAETGDTEVRTIVCGTTTGYQPYVYTDENDELVGYDIELIKAVFDRLPQYELQFELNDWDSILTGLDSGKYDISTECIFYSEERAEKYYFSDPISYDPVVAVHASNDGKKITSFDDLEGETVPGSAGDIWTIALENYLEANPDKNIDLDYRETDFFQLFQKAEAGDLILLTDYGMANGIQSSNDFDVTVDVLDADAVADYIDASFTYFLLSRYGDNEQFLADVNEALAEVMEDGTALEISKKYFGDDFTPVGKE